MNGECANSGAGGMPGKMLEGLDQVAPLSVEVRITIGHGERLGGMQREET
jgi:hypothetical protein